MSRTEIIRELVRAYRSMGASRLDCVREYIKLHLSSDRYLITEAYYILNKELTEL